MLIVMKYFLIAGEASGDLHGGRLIKALKNADENAEFRYLGGDFMEEASGVAPVVHYKRMAFMAFSEVLRHLPEIFGNMNRAKAAIKEFCPNAVILIDYPSFNLKIAEYASSLNIPVYYYISPKLWAWKEYRIKSIKRYVRKVYSILPFETEFYAHHGYEAEYVGNPTVNEIEEARKSFPDFLGFVQSKGIHDRRPIIALLPGSRLGEIRNNLAIMYKAASRFADFQPVVAAAPNIDKEFYSKVLRDNGVDANPTLVSDSTFELVANSAVALVTSGTATLETAIIGTPQVVCYRANGSKLAYKLFEHILKVPFVSLPNLIAGKEVVKELLLHNCTEDNIYKAVEPLLYNTPQWREMEAGYKLIKERLGDSDSAAVAADDIIKDLHIINAK